MAKIGIEKVMKNLNAEVKKIKGQTMGGLLAGGAIVQRESMKRVPVEYGNMRASAFTRKAMDTTERMAVEVGYTAFYAPYVHENMEQSLKGQPRKSGLGVYWGPAGEPKFLQNAVQDKTTEVVAAIARHAKKKTGAA